MMDTIAFKTLQRPSAPNTYLVAPEGLCEQSAPDKILRPFPAAPGSLFTALMSLIEDKAGWKVERSDAEQNTIWFVATSHLMRYKDDVDILILPDEAESESGRGSRLAIYSRSRIGHSDLGANRRRVKHLLECLNKMQVRA